MSNAEPNHRTAEARRDNGASYVQDVPAPKAGGRKSRKPEDMVRPTWLSTLTQHGSRPPFMLKVRSSDGFIIVTISLAVFTVRTLNFSTKAKELTMAGHVSVRRHCTCHSFRHPVTQSCRRKPGTVLGLGTCCDIRCIASCFLAHLWLAC
jgi:hypothetical protein